MTDDKLITALKKYTGGTVNLTLSLPYLVKIELEELVQKAGMSRNGLIVKAIKEMLKREG